MSQTPTPGELIEIRRVKAIVANAGYSSNPQCFIGPTGPQGPQGPAGYVTTPSTITSDNAVLIYTSSSGIVGSQLFTFTSSINSLGIVNIKGVLQVESGITTPFTQLNQQTSIPLISTGVLWYNQTTQSLFVDGENYSPLDTLVSSINSLNYALTSSITGLGTEGYISSASLTSSILGVETLGYVTMSSLTSSLTSSITGLGTSGYTSTTSINNALFSLVIPNTVASGSLLFNSAKNSLIVNNTDTNAIVTSLESYQNIFFTSKAIVSDTTGATKVGIIDSSNQINNYFYNYFSGLFLHTNGTNHYIKPWNSNDSLVITITSLSTTSQIVSFYVNGNLIYTQATTDSNVTYRAAFTYFITGDSYTDIVFSGSYGFLTSASTSVFLTSYPFQFSPTFSTINMIDTGNEFNILTLSNYNSTLYFNNTSFITNDVVTSSLTSSIIGLGSLGYISSYTLINSLTSSIEGLGTSGYISTTSLTSTVEGLGSSGYISTYTLINSLTSSIEGLGSASYISSASLQSTVEGLGDLGYISSYTLINSLTSSIEGLGSASYLSSPSLQSTVEGLGDLGYISTYTLINSLISSIEGLGESGYISSTSLQSTVEGLGDLGYISSYTLINSLTSSIEGLGSASYISSASLQSTVEGLGDLGYISSYTLINSLTSSIEGLGESGYISSFDLQSTIQGLGTSGYYISTASLNNALFSLAIPDSSPPGALVFNSITNSLVAYNSDLTSIVTSVESYQNVFFTTKAYFTDTGGFTKLGLLDSSNNFNNYFFNNSSSLYIFINGYTPLIKLWNSNDVLAISLVSQSASNQTVTFYVNGSAVYSQATTDNSLTYKAAFTYFNTGDTFTNIVFSGSYGFLTSTNTSVFLASYPYVSSPTYSIINITDVTNSSNYISLINSNMNLYIDGVPAGSNNNNSLFSLVAFNTYSYTDITLNSALNSILVNTNLASGLVNSVESYNNVFFSCKANILDTTSNTLFGLMDSNISSNIPAHYFFNSGGFLNAFIYSVGNVILNPFNSNDVLDISIVNSLTNTSKVTFYVNGSNVYSSSNLTTNSLYNASFFYLNSNDSYTNIVFAGSFGILDSNTSVFLSSYPFLQSPIVSSIQIIDSANQSNILQLSNYQSTLYFNGFILSINNNNSLYSLVIPPGQNIYTNSATNTLYYSNSGSNSCNVFSVESYPNVFFSCKASLLHSNSTYPFGLVNNTTNTFEYCFMNSNGNLYTSNVGGSPQLIDTFNSNDVLAITYANTSGVRTIANIFYYVNGSNVSSDIATDPENTLFKIGFNGFTGSNGSFKGDSYTNIVFTGSYAVVTSNTSIFAASYPFLQSPILSTIQIIDGGNSSNILLLSNYNSTLYFNNNALLIDSILNSTLTSTVNSLTNYGFVSSLSSRNNSLFTLLWDNLNDLSFNSLTNTLIANSNSSASNAITLESYHSVYFSCTPILTLGNQYFGIVDTTNTFRYYFNYSGNNLQANVIRANNINVSCNIKPYNSTDVLSITVTTTSNISQSQTATQFYVNGIPQFATTFSDNTSPGSSPIITDTPQFKGAFSNFSNADTYKQIVFAGAYAIPVNIGSNVGIALTSYPNQYAPIFSTISLIDTLNSENILNLSNYLGGLYFNGVAITGSESIFVSTASQNNAMFTLTDSNNNFLYNPATNSITASNGLGTVTTVEAYQSLFFSCKTGFSNTNSNEIFGLVNSNTNTFAYYFYGSNDGNIYTNPGDLCNVFPYNPIPVKAYNSNDTFSIGLTNTVAATSNLVFSINGTPVYIANTSNYGTFYKVGFSNFNNLNTYSNIVITGSFGNITSTSATVFPSHTSYISSPNFLNVGLTDYANSSNTIPLSNYNSTLYYGGFPVGGATLGNFSTFTTIGIGCNAISVNPSLGAIGLGFNAGLSNMGLNAIAIGYGAASNTSNAGSGGSNINSIAIGVAAGSSNQNSNSIAIGCNAGYSYQSPYSIAIGTAAGSNLQGSNGESAIAIGNSAAFFGQDSQAIAIGFNAGSNLQGSGAIAIGCNAGSNGQLKNTIAIGTSATSGNSGISYAVALGYNANASYNNSIVVNASGTSISADTASAFFVNPVRYVPGYTSNLMVYDSNTSEILFSDYTFNIIPLTSTVGGLGSSGYSSTIGITLQNLQSSIKGLGDSGYVSSVNLQSTNTGLGTLGYISSASLQSTVVGLVVTNITSSNLQSTVQGLGTLEYISSTTLQSTVQGLGSLGYISSTALQSTVQGLGNSGYISSFVLQSTVEGLGSLGYISSASLQSTVIGLGGESGYIISTTLQSTVIGLGTAGYISTGVSLSSVITSLGSYGYISTPSLTSTVQGLGTAGYFSTLVQINPLIFSTLTSIGLGSNAGSVNLGAYAVAIGYGAGQNNQGTYSVALGYGAGNFQSNYTIAIGSNAGSNQNTDSIAIGQNAGVSQNTNSVAIGSNAGSNQPTNSIAIGFNSGIGGAASDSVIAIGNKAGGGQGSNAIAIGCNAAYGYTQFAYTPQTQNAVAIGTAAAFSGQGDSAIAIGFNAGFSNQGLASIAIGCNAGFQGQGANAIAIGANAGYTNQPANTIILNASGINLSPATSGAFYVNPVRSNASGTNIVSYNSTTFEVFYSETLTIDSLNAIIGVQSNGTYLTSDSNVKENINSADLPLCYETVKQLPLRRFTYISSIASSKHDKTQIGFLAQETYPIFPKSIYSTFSDTTSTSILHMNFDQIFMSHYGATQLLISTTESTTAHTQQQDSTLQFLQNSQLEQESTLQGQGIEILTLMTSYQTLFTQVSSLIN